MIVRQFQSHKSVFKEWVPDNPERFKTWFKLDMSRTRLKKWINNDGIYQEVWDVLYLNLPKLKEILANCNGICSYPYMSWLEFTSFCSKWKLPGMLIINISIDRNFLPMSIIDVLYISSIYDKKDEVQNENSYMCRYEFIECIVRIAHEKYVKSRFCKSLPQAVGVVLNEHLFKHSSFVLP
jgi:hypothetical protein